MKRASWIACVLIPWATLCLAQGPVFTQEDLQTFSFEDFSDVLRRFPGMYPLDYGTFGAPVIIWPWQQHPWLLRIEKDGIPERRLSDGLYDASLQPLGEIGKADYRLHSGGALGTIHLKMREVSVDTPYTEFQIREGYYGYGTVDFLHSQRVYKSLALDLSGRLGWYNGLRYQTASRFNRVRGRLGYDLGRKWRSELTYAGSNVDSEFPSVSNGYYTEREEGILVFHRVDSVVSQIEPSVRLFVRQDRESWGSPFRLREQSWGYVGDLALNLARHHIRFRQSSIYADMDVPNVAGGDSLSATGVRGEMSVDFLLSDSLDFRFAGMRIFAGVNRVADWADTEVDHVVLSRGGVEFRTQPLHSLSLHGGSQYSEEHIPLLWRAGNYNVADRPLPISSAFGYPAQLYRGSSFSLSGVDRYVTSSAGLEWRMRRAMLDVTGIALYRPGDFENRFHRDDSGVTLVHDRRETDAAELGVAISASVPLRYGLRVDSWWFRQGSGDDLATTTDLRGYTRLYFEHDFFHTPLTIRSHISYEEIGQRNAFSDKGTAVLGPNRLIGFRLSATIRGVTLIWGTENFFKEHYSLLPGYSMIAKEEYLAFIWRLWL